MYVLLTEGLGEEAPPPEEVDDLHLVLVPLPQPGPLHDVIRERGDPGEGGGGRLSQHEEPVGEDEGVDGGGAVTVLQPDLDSVLSQELTLQTVSWTVLTGGATDWQRAPGAG